MLPFQTILHPTDFSDRSQNAFRVACGLARDYDAQLMVMHVWSRPTLVYGEVVVVPQEEDYYRQAEKNLHQFCAGAGDLRIQQRLVEGEEVSAILHVAKEAQADLIVMGVHPRNVFGRLFLGSVAEKVVRGATCPVMTIRMPYPEASVALARDRADAMHRRANSAATA